MDNRTLTTILILLIFSFLSPSHASSINYGALQSDDDGTTEIISDSLNNVEWLRLDALANLNYAQTLTSTSSVGAYNNWNIAHNFHAQQFIDAMFSPDTPTCSINTGPNCGNPAYNDGDFGGNFDPSSELVFFISDNNIGQEVGLITLSASGITKDDEWASIDDSDKFSLAGANSALPISWLLYREMNTGSIPEPLPTTLITIGLIGIAISRKRKVEELKK